MKTRLHLITAALFTASIFLTQHGRAQTPWQDMDYGPTLGASITMPGSDGRDPSTITAKGIVVQLGRKGIGRVPASICFDTDLLRYSAGWTDGWLTLMGTPFDGTHNPPKRSRPAINGKVLFTTGFRPGWSTTGTFADPRDEPYGPVPKTLAQFKGHYLNGNRVVFHYTVGGVNVLDAPAHEAVGLAEGVGRVLRVDATDKPLHLLVAEGAKASLGASAAQAAVDDATVMLINATGGKGRLYARGGMLTLTIQPSDKPQLLKLIYLRSTEATANTVAALRKNNVEDPATLIAKDTFRGRFADTITTQGKINEPRRNGVYAVDDLTLPADNPWKAWMRPSAFDFFPDGRAAVATWSGDVWIASNITGELKDLKWKRFATGLYQPLGLKIVDGVIHTLGRDQITRLHDLNGDGEADHYECFNNGCKVTPNYHEFASDLATDAEGNFYYCKGAPVMAAVAWGPKSSHSGCLLRVSKDGSTIERFATGLRASNGLSVRPASLGKELVVTCADNEGFWVPAAGIHFVKQGEFLGAIGMSHRPTQPTSFDQPMCWLPKALDNSSGSQVWVTSDQWGIAKGRLLHLSYGKARLFHTVSEQVDGVTQGGAVRFRIVFDTGIMRGQFHPTDGQLYVAGLKGWNTAGVRPGGLYRMRYTNKPVHTIEKVRTVKDGFEITFTNPLNKDSASDADNWYASRWNYKWTKSYGSPEYSIADPRRKARDPVTVTSASLLADGRTVKLVIDDMKPAMQMMMLFSLKAADGSTIEQELFYTVHRVPAQ